MQEEKKLFLLDGMALIYRAFFAFSQNPRITSKGLNASAMFGFTNTLLEILKNQKPTHIAVVFDTSAPTARHEMYEKYKAHRQEMPEDLRTSIPYIFRIIEGFDIPVITLDGYEADDIIGTLAIKAQKEGFKVYMMTPDKDFGQLVDENIFIYKPARMGNDFEVMGVYEVCKKWEIENVSQVIDILGLWGDAVDNIPGVPGVGEKTAKKLVAEYGTVENIIANKHLLKGSLVDKFTEFAEQAMMSKKLATIDIDVPVELELNKLVMTAVKPELKQVFEELEFRNLAQRVFGEPLKAAAQPASAQGSLFDQNMQPSEQVFRPDTKEEEETVMVPLKTIHDVAHNYKLIQSEAEISKLATELTTLKEFCFDTETTGLDASEASIVGLAISFKEGHGFYIPFPADFEKSKNILELFQPAFNGKGVKIAQNLKYDLSVLTKYGIEITEPFFDTMLAHYLLEPDKRHNMDALSETYLQYTPVSIESLIGKKGKDQLNMADVDLEKIKEYAVEDADITLKLKHIFEPQLEKQNAVKVFNEAEMPLVPVLAAIEQEGVRIDFNFLNNYSKELSELIKGIEGRIYEMAGIQFNIASPKQLGEILFDRLKLDDKAKKTKTGQYQTGEDVLLKLESKSPLVKEILDFRELQKLKSTYVDALPLLINPRTGRVHTTFNQAVAATGRLSSTAPNLQNIPVRTDKGKEVRKAFIPRDDQHVLLSVDYSQIELRVIASMSNDEGMIAAFKAGHDIHTATAAKIYNIPLEEVTKEMRYKAKSVNFGLIYGQGAFGLAENLGITRTEAKEIIDNYFIQFPRIRGYMDETIAFAKSNEFVETLMGRRRYIRDINSANATVRSFAERNAINAPIQGTAADMIKLAMVKIHKLLNSKPYKTRMILQVHDELLFDAPIDEVEIVKPLIMEAMQNAMPLKVPVLVEAGIGKNWLEAH